MANVLRRTVRLGRTWASKGFQRPQFRSKSSSEAPATEYEARMSKTAESQIHVTSTDSRISVSSQILAALGYPGRLYTNAQTHSPYMTQLLTSIVIYFAGDLSSQYVRRPQVTDLEDGDTSSHNGGFFSTTYDPIRSLRNCIIGAISSIPSYRWFLYLGTLCNYQSMALSLAAKVVINQIAFTPLFNSYFFAMQSLLAGVLPSRTAAGNAGSLVSPASLLEDPKLAMLEAGLRVRDTVPTSWYNSCFFWPFVTAFNYRFIAPRNRSAFAGCVAVGWQTYLGLLNQRAADKEIANRSITDRA